MKNPISPNAVDPRLGPDHTWSTVELDDLDSSGYQAIEDWAVGRRLTRALGEKRNKFVSGASSFITYTIRDRPRQEKKKVATAVNTPVNEKARVTASQRKSMTAALDMEISSISDFLWSDILPFSLAWQTAVSNTEERLSQVIGAEKLPFMAYVKGRVSEAAQLRINRFISEQFKLEPKEAEMLQMQMKHRYQVYLQKEIAASNINTNPKRPSKRKPSYDDEEVPE